MKHIKSARKDPRHQNWYSKFKKYRFFLFPDPITVEGVLEEHKIFPKLNTKIHEMKIHSEPGNDTLPTIKIRFRPLDNPKLVINLLKRMAVIKKGLVGKNITTGPNQYAFYS